MDTRECEDLASRDVKTITAQPYTSYLLAPTPLTVVLSVGITTT
jgi:hypothetical protein